MAHIDAADPNAFDRAVVAVRAGAAPADEAARLFDRLSGTERLWLLDGDVGFWKGAIGVAITGYNRTAFVHGRLDRLGIPGIRFIDGPRGCAAGAGTAFPVPMARGATWDVALEERVGNVIGREVRAMGANFFGGVCINLPRHPSWGRAQETYGDEPYHLGEFGAALTRGAQHHVMACVKHFALNSMENARFKIDVQASEADMHDMYLPHFKRVVDEGVAAIMTAYNAVNGEWAGQDPYLLTTVLREQWGWSGITVSDFVWGLRDAGASLNAGLDLEEPFRQQRAMYLEDQLARGEASFDAVRTSGIRLIAAQLRSYATRSEGGFPVSVMANDEARALAREVASRAMVLLKNEAVGGTPVLPVDPGTVRTIALIGRLAVQPNMGDAGSSNVRAPSHVTPHDGIRVAFPDARIVLITDDDPQAAARAAGQADLAIVVAGYDKADEGEFVVPGVLSDPATAHLMPPIPGPLRKLFGALAKRQTKGAEGGDRASLTLRPVDEAIIAAVSAANPRTVVSVVASGAVIMEAWRHQVPAILMMWYAGMEGGHALADILTGRREPTGRLPYSIPTSPDHLPFTDRDADTIVYDRLHGQRLLDHLDVAAAFPHGFGLGYTDWSIDTATVGACDGEAAMLIASVRNRGVRDGRHVVQVYGRASEGPYAGQSMLMGFVSVAVSAGQTCRVEVPISLVPLACWDAGRQRRIAPSPSKVLLRIGAHANDPRMLEVSADG